MALNTEQITVLGRRLEIATCGDPNGDAILFHHGTPGATPLIEYFDDAAASRGLLVVTTSRAGYGLSDRDPERTVASVVGDSRAVMDHVKKDRYVAVGWSGGGPHALACAALDTPRCRGAISLAGVAPQNDQFDWTEGMGPENIAEFELARQGGPEYEAHMKAAAESMAHVTADLVVDGLGGLLSEVDKAALAPLRSREILAAAFSHGMSGGHYGFLDDDQCFMHDWGFELSDIASPVEVWFGDQDLMVPASHGHYLVGAIPGARSEHRANEGHVSLVSENLEEILDHALEILRS